MKRLSLLTVLFIIAFTSTSSAQRALPGFTVKELSRGKIQVSWINPYPDCNQLAVQRSSDSSRNFRTIFSAQSPELPSNGFVDTKAVPGVKMYYRIFYVLKGGSYYFSAAQSIGETINYPDPSRYDEGLKNTGSNPGADITITVYNRKKLAFRFKYPEYNRFRDSVINKTKDSLYTVGPENIDWRPYIPGSKEYISVYRNDSLLTKLELADYKKFKDSISLKTKDTLYVINANRVTLRPFMIRTGWLPSPYVYTNPKGYLTINLPQVKQHNYRIIFFEDNGSELFQVRSIKESELILDKANFIHAGWFRFELFEDDKLKERNRFYLQKD